MSEIERCLEPHPEQDGIICDLPFHAYGYHYYKAGRLSWEKAPAPSTQRPKPERIIDLVKSVEPERRTGPPTGGVKPYIQDGAPSAGYSGTDTSREGEPARSANQMAVYRWVHDHQHRGATVKEAREGTGLHHGVVSGALSVLAKAGHLVMTEDKRDGCRVYLDPQYLPENSLTV